MPSTSTFTAKQGFELFKKNNLAFFLITFPSPVRTYSFLEEGWGIDLSVAD